MFLAPSPSYVGDLTIHSPLSSSSFSCTSEQMYFFPMLTTHCFVPLYTPNLAPALLYSLLSLTTVVSFPPPNLTTFFFFFSIRWFSFLPQCQYWRTLLTKACCFLPTCWRRVVPRMSKEMLSPVGAITWLEGEGVPDASVSDMKERKENTLRRRERVSLGHGGDILLP